MVNLCVVGFLSSQLNSICPKLITDNPINVLWPALYKIKCLVFLRRLKKKLKIGAPVAELNYSKQVIAKAVEKVTMVTELSKTNSTNYDDLCEETSTAHHEKGVMIKWVNLLKSTRISYKASTVANKLRRS